MSRRRSNGEGSIYRRASDGLWIGSLTLDGRQKPIASGKRRSDVADKLEEARRRLKADEPVKDAQLTVAMFVQDWTRKALPASGRKPTTIENYRIVAVTHLVPAPFGAITLDKLRPSDIEALLTAKRQVGLSDSTVRLIYTVARNVLDIAVRDGLVRRNVAASVRRPTIKRAEARYLTVSEVGRLLEAARGIGWSLSSCSCSALVYVAVKRWRCIGATLT
jgi:integrase